MSKFTPIEVSDDGNARLVAKCGACDGSGLWRVPSQAAKAAGLAEPCMACKGKGRIVTWIRLFAEHRILDGITLVRRADHTETPYEQWLKEMKSNG